MWIGNFFIVPKCVEAVQSLGKNGSKGCAIWLTSGYCVESKFPATQVVAALGLTSHGELR